MDAEKVAFWGIVLKPSESAELDLKDGETLRVTTASYGEELKDKSGRSVVTASLTSDDDSAPKTFAVAVLTAGKSETVTIDVAFVGEENVTFSVSGKNAVHLVGNFSFEKDFDDDEDSDEEEDQHLIGLYDDDETMESDGEDEKDAVTLGKLLAKDKPIITELSDDDELDNKKKPGKLSSHKKKKGKKGETPNGKLSAKPKGSKVVDTEPKSQAKPNGSSNKAAKTESKEKSSPAANGKRNSEKKARSGKRKSGRQQTNTSSVDQESKATSADRKTGESEVTKSETAKEEKMKVDKTVTHDAAESTPTKERKRNRNQNGAASGPAVSTPSKKKAKISQRPATPAASRPGRKSKNSSNETPKPNTKAQSSQKTEKTGKPEKAEQGTPSTGGGSGKKKRRGRKVSS